MPDVTRYVSLPVRIAGALGFATVTLATGLAVTGFWNGGRIAADTWLFSGDLMLGLLFTPFLALPCAIFAVFAIGMVDGTRPRAGWEAGRALAALQIVVWTPTIALLWGRTGDTRAVQAALLVADVAIGVAFALAMTRFPRALRRAAMFFAAGFLTSLVPLHSFVGYGRVELPVVTALVVAALATLAGGVGRDLAVKWSRNSSAEVAQ